MCNLDAYVETYCSVNDCAGQWAPERALAEGVVGAVSRREVGVGEVSIGSAAHSDSEMVERCP